MIIPISFLTFIRSAVCLEDFTSISLLFCGANDFSVFTVSAIVITLMTFFEDNSFEVK